MRARPVIGRASALHHVTMLVAATLLVTRGAADLGAFVLAALLAGWVTLSLVAYSIHRFVFHGRGPLVRAHARHHADPRHEQTDALSMFGPMAILLAAWLLVAASGGTAVADGVAAGGCLGYSWFRLVHRVLHVSAGHTLFHRQVAFHLRHHGSPDVNFGVTTRVWDHLFGTHADVLPAWGRPVRTRERP